MNYMSKSVKHEYGKYGCPLITKFLEPLVPQVHLFEGDVDLGRMEGDFMVREIFGRNHHHYTLTAKKAGCLMKSKGDEKKSKTTSKINKISGIYIPCYVSIRNSKQSKFYSEAEEYEIINSTNGNGLVWPTDADELYYFELIVLDPYVRISLVPALWLNGSASNSSISPPDYSHPRATTTGSRIKVLNRGHDRQATQRRSRTGTQTFIDRDALPRRMHELRTMSFGSVLSLFLLLISTIPSRVLANDDSAKLPAEHRMGEGLTWDASTSHAGADAWASAKEDLPQIKNLNVACEKNRMRVFVEFDRPFYGTVFSKGHYSDDQCVHLLPGTGRLSTTFDIFQNKCGMTARSGGGSATDGSGTGAYIENTIIIQYDPLVQEVWDQARKLRCTWYDYYEKSITFKAFNVDTLQAVTRNFLGDNLQCWMQIQMGKGPWASEVSGIVKIGQTMTMVLAIKDDENKFDMLVRSCVAHDGKRQPIQLVDQHGCVVRTKIMDKFQKIRNFGTTASVVSYATFQAFKFPDSMNVYFQCVIQVCREQCPDPSCENEVGYVDPRIPQKVPILGATSPEETLLSDSLSFADFSHLPNEKAQTFPFPGEVNQQRLPPPPTHGVPVPVPIPLPQGFPAVGRVGVAPINDSTNPSTAHPAMVAGPRSFDDVATANAHAQDTISRHRRSDTTSSSEDSTDVRTVGKIQVVAPGDVAFSLGDTNETVVISRSHGFGEKSVICMSMPGFIAGLVLLLLVLSIALIVAGFLVFRLRSQKTQVPYEGYDNPEYVKGEIMS